MSAHPRCGRNIATATSTTSFGNAFALAVGLVWGWCRDSAARFFYLAFFDHGASCVVGFKVSPLLGSIRGELECWWEDNPECMFLSLNHRRNAMEFCIPSLNYNVKNFETGRTQCVVRSCDFPQYCGSNGKWWVYFDYNSLWIHNLELTGSCAPTGDEVGAAHKVKLPRMFFYEGTSVFFNNLNPDEGILCNCGSTGHFYEVELTVIQLEESWAHKEFMQVNETEWHCDPDIASFTDALVLKKSSGIVSFIVAIEKNGRFPWLKEVYPMLPPKLQIVNIDEGCTTYDEGTPLHSVLHSVQGISQLSESLFCVSGNDPIFEIWDVNNLSGSLRVVEHNVQPCKKSDCLDGTIIWDSDSLTVNQPNPIAQSPLISNLIDFLAFNQTKRPLGRQQQDPQLRPDLVSPSVLLSSRDQLAALAMAAHPRCGGNAAPSIEPQKKIAVVRLLWDWCHSSSPTRFFYMSCVDLAKSSGVITFRVSAVLGSIVGNVEFWWEDRTGWTMLSVDHMHNALGLCVRFPFCSFSIRSLDTGQEWRLVDRCSIMKILALQCYSNGKWWVYLDYRNTVGDSNVAFIGKISQRENCSEGIVSHKVTMPSQEVSDRVSFFFNNLNPDEVILCECWGQASKVIVEVTVFRCEESWATKRLAVLSSTKFRAQDIEGVAVALVFNKKNGTRSFILSVGQSDGSGPQTGSRFVIVQVEEGSTDAHVDHLQSGHNKVRAIWQMSESMFCVSGSEPRLEIWDINNTGGGAMGCVDVGCSSICDWDSVFFEGGLMFNIIGPTPDATGKPKRSLEVTEPTSGRHLLSLGHNFTIPPIAHSFLI
ncbi:hypothetical protein Pelo_1159 [Pelomyxa schiedti]|nr:hypothetical protein Pelo_1159 [Pelomyxa schiedti]